MLSVDIEFLLELQGHIKKNYLRYRVANIFLSC